MSGGEGEMIPGSFTLAGLVAKSLVGMSLLLPVAIDRTAPWLLLEPGTAASIDQRNAVVETLVSSATECIARTVSTNPRLVDAGGAAEFNDLIVESVPSCTEDLRAMIEAYDHIYGQGAGETFFSGAYLDGLPAAVTTRVKDVR